MSRRILVPALMNLLGHEENEYQIKCTIKSIIAIKENIRVLSILYLDMHIKCIDNFPKICVHSPVLEASLSPHFQEQYYPVHISELYL